MEEIRVFIIDDHKLFIEGIYALLSDETGLKFIGNCNCPKEFTSIMDDIDADVFLVDINMPEMSGITLTQLILEKKPDAKILGLTMHDDFRHIEKMIKSGALGYSLKSDNIKELVKGIKTVAAGKKFICDSIQGTVLNQIGSLHFLEENEDVRKSKLTKREIEILLLIVKEFSNSQIAEKLFISSRTVETHRKNIFAKANTNSALGLLKHAIKEGIIAL